MRDLYIYAYPAQMLTFQIITSDGKIITNENYELADVVRATNKYLNGNTPIYNIYVVGGTSFADKVQNVLTDAFNHKTKIERIYND